MRFSSNADWLSRRSLVLGAASAVGLGVAGELCFRVEGVQRPIHVVQRVSVLGTWLSIVVRHPDERASRAAIRNAVREVFDVHHMMTLHQPSVLTDINGSRGGEDVPVPIMEVLWECRRISLSTDGLFDPTVGRVVKHIDRFVERNERLPSSLELAPLVEGVGLSYVEFDSEERSVELSHPGAVLDFNGIAKGYAVDRASASLCNAGFSDFLVNAGGDLYAAGSAVAGGRGWKVHLESLVSGESPVHTFELSDQAVATSGNTRRAQLVDGGRVSHLVHPDKGIASQRFSSVSAIASTAMEADGFSTALFVANPTEAKRIVSEQENLEAWGLESGGRLCSI